ncbi:MAG: hypothetical protein MK078_07360 [Crocinitomicaceae bacterium]|nr:hypothetical protein [Crocinitomicaceae bacterium]
MTVDVWEPSAVFPDSSNYLRFDTLGTGGYALPTHTIVLDLNTPLSPGPTFTQVQTLLRKLMILI